MVNDICFKNRQHLSLMSVYRHKKDMLNSFYLKNPSPPPRPTYKKKKTLTP